MSVLERKYLDVSSFLNNIYDGAEIEIYETCRNGWLRPAMISHLCYLFSLERPQAANMIDRWVEEE